MKNNYGRLNTFTSSSLSVPTGYIEPGDLCKILEFYSNGAVKVTYPTSSGSRTAYAPISGFLGSENFSTSTRTLNARLTAYRRSSGSAAIGTVFASDQVTVIANENGRTQLIFPVPGGYKIGWVNGSYSMGNSMENNPQGCIDIVSSPKAGTLRAGGWAFDRDNLNTSLQIHIYVGGPAGSGAPGYSITANGYRPDVNSVYSGVGNNHGFDSTISVSKSGTQTVYIYAINIGSGSNILLGSRTVNLGGNTNTDFQWPVSNYYVCGNRWSQYYSVKRKDHLGMDIKSSTGDTAIYAAGSGTVVNTARNSANGNTITIRHTISGKTVYSFYAHLSSINVSNGSTVYKGQKIGVIGNTGSSSTGTHLHFAFTTQCSAGTWGYGTAFNDSANSASYSGYTFYNPSYIIANGKLP